MPRGQKSVEKKGPSELVERVPEEIRRIGPKPLITEEVLNSTFMRRITSETYPGIPQIPFKPNVVDAVSGMEADRQKRVLGILKDPKTGTNCALATLTAVSKLVAAGELHGVEVLGARGREPEFGKLGPILGQLNRKQVEAMLKAIEANPSEEVVGLADRIRSGILEAQK